MVNSTAVMEAPRYNGLHPSSVHASERARAASRKRDTRCEHLLRRALWKLGLRYRIHVAAIAGRPDVVFARARVVVFCDGDFWHGRDLENRIAKLGRGHNAPYWMAKIRANVERDRQNYRTLADQGWLVLRFWEKDIQRNATAIAATIESLIAARLG